MFPSMMKKSNVPHFEILGAPIGDAIFCAKFVSQNVQWPPSCSHRWRRLALWIPKLQYSSCTNAGLFCKLVHLAQ